MKTTIPVTSPVTFDGISVSLLLQAALQSAPILEQAARQQRADWPDTYCDGPEWAAFLVNKHALDHALKNLKRGHSPIRPAGDTVKAATTPVSRSGSV